MIKKIFNLSTTYIINILLVTIILLIFSVLINAQPDTKPVLRIERGVHADFIRKVSVDSNERFLVTASDDKTARVWDLTNGKLLQVLRPPIGSNAEGRVFSATISPDGKIVAVGGITGWEWDKFPSIYIFNRANGQIIRRVTNLQGTILSIKFSPNGKLLLVTGAGGIRLYDTNNWKLLKDDKDYGAASWDADFDKTGNRFVTSSDDGFVRLYSVNLNGFQLITKKTLQGGNRPVSIKFSPDSKKIAVGFSDSYNLNVISSTSLELLFEPKSREVDNGNLSSVAWSSDGKTLYAAGTFQMIGAFLIKFWTEGDDYYTYPSQFTIVANNAITDIKTLSKGIVFGTAKPTWGIINQREWLLHVLSANADFRSRSSNFFTSYDGMKVGFGYNLGKSPAQFSLISRELKIGEVNNTSLRLPKTKGLDIKFQPGTTEPTLNGRKLALSKNEKTFGLAISPDNSKFLLGTLFSVRAFDKNGKELWQNDSKGLTAAVNISGNGKLAIAAFNDGTIRWYRISDGKELLAFFPHSDQKRWVLWTPSGYYDASPNSEDLIGWHVNNGKEKAADFFPVGLFRDKYYRPDVISKVLYTLDEDKALKLANEEAGRREQEATIPKRLPPVVEILSPQDGIETLIDKVTIRYKVRSDLPITSVKTLIDGRPSERGVGVRPNNSKEITVTIPKRDSEISIIAENSFAPSVPAKIKIKWKGKVPAISVENLKPKLYILAIGVSKYKNAAFNLGLASKDAKDFVNVISKQKKLLYRDIEVKLLTDSQATRDNIADGLEWITRQTTSRDVAMVFMAGHGINDNLNRYYFAPHNFNPESLLRTGVTFSNIKNTVEAIPGKVLFFIDSCHSGNSIGTSRKRRDGAVDINGVLNELSSAENGAFVFNSSTGKQVSLEDPKWNNGAFTKALVEGLSGKAATKDGKISVKSLDLYVSERVKQLTGGSQTPTTAVPNTVPDFPIAVRIK